MTPGAYVPARTGCPSCGGPAEPEEEDGLRKFVCVCGYEFGHQMLTVQQDSCSLGIPADIRISASQPPGVLTLESGDDRRSVFLGSIGRRPE